MKKQVVRTKLQLDRSTLRTLTPERLQQVNGGGIIYQVSNTCQPCTERGSSCNGPLTMTA